MPVTMTNSVHSGSVPTTLTDAANGAFVPTNPGEEIRADITFCNVSTADVTLDLTRAVVSVDRYILKNTTLKVGETLMLSVRLMPGMTMKWRASASSSVDYTVDRILKKVT